MTSIHEHGILSVTPDWFVCVIAFTVCFVTQTWAKTKLTWVGSVGFKYPKLRYYELTKEVEQYSGCSPAIEAAYFPCFVPNDQNKEKDLQVRGTKEGAAARSRVCEAGGRAMPRKRRFHL